LENSFQQFLYALKNTSLLEYFAVITGIASVWYSRKENILTYPFGLINTTIYIFLSFQNYLIGEAGVNLYYTVMNIYGWTLWSKKDKQLHPTVVITYSNSREWIAQTAFFLFFYLLIFLLLTYLKKEFYPGAIPLADAFASAAAFTAMLLMARKKVESWYWWILTNISSIPLYFVKGLVLTSVYYFILLVFAFWGLAEWSKRSKTKLSY
jgi:nicotinamide mononucleotide transporter